MVGVRLRVALSFCPGMWFLAKVTFGERCPIILTLDLDTFVGVRWGALRLLSSEVQKFERSRKRHCSLCAAIKVYGDTGRRRARILPVYLEPGATTIPNHVHMTPFGVLLSNFSASHAQVPVGHIHLNASGCGWSASVDTLR